MESGTSEFVYPVDCQIPIDFFGSKKHPGVTRGDLAFANSSGSIVFKVNRQSRKSSLTSNNKKVLLDDSGNPLYSIYRYHVSPSLLSLVSLENQREISRKLCFVRQKIKMKVKISILVMLVLICRISRISTSPRVNPNYQ